jgi:uncharacterized protein
LTDETVVDTIGTGGKAAATHSAHANDHARHLLGILQRQPGTGSTVNGASSPAARARSPRNFRTAPTALKKLRIVNRTRNRSLGDAIELADTGKTRRVGLLKRTGLAPGEGLWIFPCEGIHTFFMRFDIDVLFLDKHKRVVKAVERLRPWRMSLSLRGRSVLELPAGVIAESETRRGDQLEVIEPA